jgi:uncharacterized protein YycO
MPIPLDPGSGGRSIRAGALEVADIIVSTHADDLTSKIIREATNSPVSHTTLYVGGGLVVEAIKEGVVQRSLKAAVAGAALAVAYRRPGLTEEQTLAIRDYAGSQIGKPYNFGGLPGLVVNKSTVIGLPHGLTTWIITQFQSTAPAKRRKEDNFFCSELILAAYQTQGQRQTKQEPNWGTPEDVSALRIDGTLTYVGHLKAPNA